MNDRSTESSDEPTRKVFLKFVLGVIRGPPNIFLNFVNDTLYVLFFTEMVGNF